MPPSISSRALSVLQDDASLPICVTCGTQYPSSRDRCVICEDPRQFVPASGQEWTSLSDLLASRKHVIRPDEEDGRVSFIHTEPAFGINQTPILLETAGGSYIWDCAAFISPHLIAHLLELEKPLKAIAISHPHFFATSLTWARTLQVPLYLCEADKEWYQRLDDIEPSDDVRWWTDEVELGSGVKVIQCGGHFPGSSILHWDRLGEPAPPKDHLPTKPTPVSGLILTADTIMVMPTQSHFTFIWSAPNMIPLRPKQVLSILKRLEKIPFSQASSTWPGRYIRSDAKRILTESVTKHLGACGWRLDGHELVSRDSPPALRLEDGAGGGAVVDGDAEIGSPAAIKRGAEVASIRGREAESIKGEEGRSIKGAEVRVGREPEDAEVEEDGEGVQQGPEVFDYGSYSENPWKDS